MHVVGPELGYTLPGSTIVCGDSHTSTHGAFGAVAFGIGTSEVEMVLSTQCILQPKPKKMRINVNGALGKGVTAKDVILYIISQLSTGGATGYFVEYAGTTFKAMSMEARMTVCNMSIEMGARGGLIAPDETTFEYLKTIPAISGRADLPQLIGKWEKLKTDDGAEFDREISFDASKIKPMITYGTNPGMGMAINDTIPEVDDINPDTSASFLKSLDYMGFTPGEKLEGHTVDYVFLGSCTNGRIEDFRAFAKLVKGRKKASNITALLVPGSKLVEKQAREEGLDKILEAAGFELRQPGCSSCLAMNEDKIPAGKYAVATSNRNFEVGKVGCQNIACQSVDSGGGGITGKITDPRKFL